MPRLAPEIFRKRLLIEGYFGVEHLDERLIRDYFAGPGGAPARASDVSDHHH